MNSKNEVSHKEIAIAAGSPIVRLSKGKMETKAPFWGERFIFQRWDLWKLVPSVPTHLKITIKEKVR